MVYSKYIKKKGKVFGPYYYESVRDEDGKVRNVYIGPTHPKHPKKVTLQVDSEEKRKAIENAYPVQSQEIIPSWENDKNLIQWLSDLCE